jgi:hypothetical protein
MKKFMSVLRLRNDKSTVIFMVVILIGLLIIMISSQIIIQKFSSAMGVVSGIYIDDVVLTSGINTSGQPFEQTLSFSPNIKRIYCFLDIKGVFGLPMTGDILIRWYHNSKQIGAHYFQTTSRPVFLWLEPQNSEPFRTGEYMLEIFINQTLINTIEFDVK